MNRFFFLISTAWCLMVTLFTQAQVDSFQKNQVDSQGMRSGFWFIHQPAALGEPSYKEYGYYQHGQKMGPWIRVDALDRLVSQENYRWGVLDGKSKYYTNGQLVLESSFKGLNPYGIYDTFMVVDVITLLEYEVIVPSQKGSLKHGTWRYYNPENGRVIKEEIYQVDSLIATYDFISGRKADKQYWDTVSRTMPHMTDPKGKKASKTKVRRSLIE